MMHLEVEIDVNITGRMQERHDQLAAGGHTSDQAWRQAVQEQFGYLAGDVQSATLVDD